MIDAVDNLLLYVILAALVAAALAWLVYRSIRRGARAKQRILSERSGDERPYLWPPPPPPPSAGGVADEMAAATSDVVGDVLRIDTHDPGEGPDNLQLLKGCGPKLAARLNELGITRFAQLAALSETEVALVDDRLGPFRGRVARDRLVEQACYLARGDKDGFEQRFGKLGADSAG